MEILYNSNLKKYHLLFLATVIKKERYRWGYGRKPKNGKVFSTKIKLPVDQYGDINWQFMEEYIKSLPYSKYL